MRSCIRINNYTHECLLLFNVDLIKKNLSSVTDGMKTLELKNQRQNKQVLELKEDHTNLSEDIQRLQTKQVDGESDVLSLKESYLKFSVLVNETLEHFWQNQSANDDQLRDTNGQTGKPLFVFSNKFSIPVYFLCK